MINTKIFMFNRRQKELDEVFERVLAFMENSCDQSSKRMVVLEHLHIAASERIARLEEASLASSKRLDRIETILESNTISIKELNSAASNVFTAMNLTQKNFEVIQENFEIIVSQVKGVQNENRHMLEHLFKTNE
ncbi:hypothetical protein DSM106972_020400 [Dulcicalothrix desertica PCC 7102]|uniref:Uncharacterized protein n=1 Tax=Dulcicalothrix desertica PCC 7102 TaxID=232991 RepID=A0A433VNV7_9CYAN|nr:hypothetical protein [Dulcicalothrix desertica]RUT07780.1 hypothetical protein DSM106972_020400 [Dulcicalothrix desertica PCC 7102]TWH39305.1 hypothetical protein CAL7102_08528 [Dulcicalothrix desertica PCC 7102]